MRLGIDLDGVVADFNTGWIRQYNQEFSASLEFDAVQSWDAIPSLTHFRHMGEFWEWARDHGGHSLFRHLETYPGAVDTLWDLDRSGHAIVILTTKPDWAIHDTLAWLADHRIPTREIHILEQKWTVDCDIYLEDAPHNLAELRDRRPDRLVVRYVRPWNEPIPGVAEVASWETFAKLVDSVAD